MEMNIDENRLNKLCVKKEILEEGIKYYVDNGVLDYNSIIYNINHSDLELMDFYFDYLNLIYSDDEEFKFHYNMFRTLYLQLLTEEADFFFGMIEADYENINDDSIPLRCSEAYSDKNYDEACFAKFSNRIKYVSSIHSDEAPKL